FFFQAEDGRRVKLVTGVQTCTLPICRPRPRLSPVPWARTVPSPRGGVGRFVMFGLFGRPFPPGPRRPPGVLGSLLTIERFGFSRSEERRVGKGCRSQGTRCERIYLPQ